MTNEPAGATTISPPTSNVNSPSNTKAHSSSRVWVCGGTIAPGGKPTSMIVKVPPKPSVVTLWVMSKMERWAPSPGPMKILLCSADIKLLALLIFVFVVQVQFLDDAQGGRGWLVLLCRPMA